MPQLTWMITGCSPGSLGDYLAREVLSRGDNVITTARNVVKLTGLQKAGAKTMQLDVSEKQVVLDNRVKEALELAGGHIDVLVNNAGGTTMSTVEEMSEEGLVHELQVNAIGPIMLSRAFLPSWRAADKPATVVFISSAAAIAGSPASAAYSASKHALEGLVDAFHQETYSTFKVKSLVVEPGFIRTTMIDNTKLISTEMKEYQPLVDYLRPAMENLNGNQSGDPRKVCRVIVDLVRDEGCAKGKVVDPYKDWPLRLPLGTEGFQMSKKRLEGYQKVIESWENVILGVNYDE